MICKLKYRLIYEVKGWKINICNKKMENKKNIKKLLTNDYKNDILLLVQEIRTK